MGRSLPRFSDVQTESEEPTPPPRSPETSPRISNLPKLPPRKGEENNENTEQPHQEKDSTAADVSVDPEKEKKRAELRRKCLQEIFETEKGYIEDMEILINVRKEIIVNNESI